MTKDLERLINQFIKQRRIIMRKYPYALHYVFEVPNAVIEIEMQAFCKVLRYRWNIQDFVEYFAKLGIMPELLESMNFEIRRIDAPIFKVLDVLTKHIYWGFGTIKIADNLWIKDGRIIDERKEVKHYSIFEGAVRQTLIMKQRDSFSVTLEQPFIPMLIPSYIQALQSALPDLRARILRRLL